MGKAQYWNGFQLLSELDDSGLRYYPTKIATLITQYGATIFTGGYLDIATTIQGVVTPGILVTPGITVAASVANGTLTGAVIPIVNSEFRWMVPVEQNAKITQAAVGTLCDLQSANTIDISDAVTLGYGFMIEAIDVSAAAIAANAFGFAIGHFEYVAAS